MPVMLIVALAMYLILFPMLFWSIGLIDRKLKSKRLNKQLNSKGGNRNQLTRDAPSPAWPRWKERLKFTRSDKRNFVFGSAKDTKKKKADPKVLPFTRRAFYWGLRGAGLIVTVIGGLIGSFELIALSAIIYYSGIVYGYISADKILKAREAVYARMFSVARTKLGQSGEREQNPQSVIRIVEWRDVVKPQRVEFDIPDSFGEEGIEAFMKQFNQLFGRENAWVAADNEETGDPGWDFDKGVVTVRSVPPLPKKADWSEHYVLGEGVAWSFFPIGLGVENGLELPNPNTGEVEHVLGFDFSGEQAGMASKFKLKMSQAITTSPMALIAGGTGGGKSLSISTPIRTHETS